MSTPQRQGLTARVQQRSTTTRKTAALALLALAAFLGGPGCDSGDIKQQGLDSSSHVPPTCAGGTDQDGDGYGLDCPAGPDCDDRNPGIHPQAAERCDGVDQNCDGQADEGLTNCLSIGGSGTSASGQGEPFPLDQLSDPNFIESDGVGLDEDGDLTLNRAATDFHFMWIANTNDLTRGTVSKIDTKNLKEVGRYYSTTCHSQSDAGSCVDINGKPIARTAEQKPSRTAVDYNFDVWVANRALNGGQQSVSKIANDKADCIDRNGNGRIDTSEDLNGDGTIDTNSPEFVGEDDECVLFTVNFDEDAKIGRSVCLSPDKGLRPSHAWVATYSRQVNNFYRIDGFTGEMTGPFPLPAGHRVYGCAVDSQGILWSTSRDEGTLVALDTRDPGQVGPILKTPWTAHKFYGIAIGRDDHVWLGGWQSNRVYRYKPDRASFASLADGDWTEIQSPTTIGNTRGLAPDSRGWVWVSGNSGYIWRVDQQIADGQHDLRTDKSYWPTAPGSQCGVGIDMDGHVWGISSAANKAFRLQVDDQGNPSLPAGTRVSEGVAVGRDPYTYSDFTGYGLKNFTRPRGFYRYQLQPCAEGTKASWERVFWNATTPSGTLVAAQVRSGDTLVSLGEWHGPYPQSPAELGAGAEMPLSPNPSAILQVEFILQTEVKDAAPVLHDFGVAYSCDVSID